MTNWHAIAEARGLAIPQADLDSIVPVLEALEKTLRPLLDSIPPETEPATLFVDGDVA